MIFRSLVTCFAALVIQGTSAQIPCVNGLAGPYPCSNIDLLAHMSLSQLGTVTNVADLWGWTDPVTGTEYAIVGTRTGTSFVDLSVPTSPVLIGTLPAHNGVIHCGVMWIPMAIGASWGARLPVMGSRSSISHV